LLGGGKVIEIHKMKASCMSIREIARQTGHDRNTIRKYLRTGELPRPKPGPPRGSKLDPFKEHVTARMAQGLLNANRLLEELRAMGYTGGKTVLKDFMKPLRPPPKPAAVLRFETAPGEQAHVDFGVFRYQDGTRTIRVAAFAMVLSEGGPVHLGGRRVSRDRYAIQAPSSLTATFVRPLPRPPRRSR